MEILWLKHSNITTNDFGMGLIRLDYLLYIVKDETSKHDKQKLDIIIVNIVVIWNKVLTHNMTNDKENFLHISAGTIIVIASTITYDYVGMVLHLLRKNSTI